MNIDWNKLSKDELFDNKLYNKILEIDDFTEKSKTETLLFDRARLLKCATAVKESYEAYKKQYKLETKSNLVIDFGEKAPVQKMLAPGYYKDKYNCIRTFDKDILVTATPLEPIAILKNQETGEELVKCAFFNKNRWETFCINREVILHNGKITKLANKGVDVTTTSSSLLVGYIRDLLNSNDIPELKSTSKMGWFNDIFLPYDEGIEFDGADKLKPIFESITEKGSFEEWTSKIGELRKNNTVLKMVMGTSFASPLLQLLNRLSFITHLWGKTGGKKSVAGRIAMSIWGDSNKGKLMFRMDSTANFYCGIASFLNNIPCFFDELQTYRYDVNQLIMLLTEGIDRGRSNTEGGVEFTKTWHNTFIFTGEDSASSYNSGGGTLNRLIQIYITKDIVQDGMGVCDFLEENYGTAGKVFVKYIKELGKDKINEIFKEKFDSITKYDKTEEKQAINMAMILLADDLACRCIFKNEPPLTAEDVIDYVFSKEEIDNTKRAYKTFIDECVINKSKFKVDDNSVPGEFWGIIDEYEITIISKKFREIIEKNGFNYNKVVRDWDGEGIIQKNSSGKYSTNLSKNGIKANYIVIKVKNEAEEKMQELKKILDGVQVNILDKKV